MTIYKFPGSAIQSNTITITQIQTTAVTSIVTQAGPRVTSLVYPGNDTAGNTVGGQTVYINGSGFETNNAIYINGNAVPSKSFISASNLSFTTPALSTGIYPVYVINTDSGATAIFVPGYIASAEPAWVTTAGSLAADQDEASVWSYSLSATGDAPITYALASGSTLPSGISLAANGVVSGTLSSPPGTETTYTFSVVATDAENQESTRQFTVTTSSGEGVLFANNVLLIHADGTNNKNNHTFLDSSNNNFTITRGGNATQGSFSPFSQTGWSGYFDGTGDYLTTPASVNMNIGSGNFTFETWVFPTINSAGQALISFANTNAFYLNSSGIPYYAIYLAGDYALGSTAVALNTWSHLAFVRSGTTITCYINGTSVGSITNSASIGTSVDINSIGSHRASNYWNGYLSNTRVVKGTAVYTSTFTPSTTPLTNIANTSLLTCQSNRFIDNSNNNFVITRNGDTSIQAFAPFAPTAAYSTANVGGSGYFDGTGDRISVSNNSSLNLGTGDFTVECWAYSLTPLGSYSVEYAHLMGKGNGVLTGTYSLGFYLSKIYFGSTSGTTTLTSNQWYHLAVTRSGTTLRLFVNGALEATATVTTDFTSASSFNIGDRESGDANNNYPFNGYISNVRVVKGTAVYTAAFTPPTAPLTNIANTSLLCNFTNAGIFDQTAKNVLETVGDAKVSTAQYKYGTASMLFDGSGDRIFEPSNQNYNFGTGDFTIELWAYPISQGGHGSSNNDCLIDFRPGTNGVYGTLYIFNSGTGVYWFVNNANRITGGAISNGTWTHIAIARASGSTKLFINGTQSGSTYADTNNYLVSPIQIGEFNDGIGGGNFQGYIDDLRITKGNARYTTTFSPPTSALKDK